MKEGFGRAIGLVMVSVFLLSTPGRVAAEQTDPCSDAGRVEIRALTRFSKPALGNIDELTKAVDPSKPLPPQLAPIDDPNYHADQCRSVLGPLPRINCMDGSIQPVHYHAKAVTYEHGVLAVDGAPADQSILTDCDDPALLPFLQGFPKKRGGRKLTTTVGCMVNNRLGHIKIGPVDWMYSCHYRPGLHEPNDPFEFVSVIGSNQETGETCFFAHDNFKMSGAITPAPGGNDFKNEADRKEAAEFWNHPAVNTCFRCHADNKPWQVTPHLNQSRIWGDGSMDILPQTSIAKRRHPGWGYRIVGTVHNLVMPQPTAIWPKNDDGTPDRTCTRCHTVTNSIEFLREARVSVHLPDLPKYAQVTDHMPHYKTSWMPLDDSDATNLKAYQQAVLRLQRAIEDPRYRAKEENVVSPCPPPAPLAASAVEVQEEAGEVHWTYRNEYGHVATRDDIRFEVTLEGNDGTSCRFRDVAPDSLGSDQWRFHHPLRPGVRYTYHLKPYRYCFSREPYRDGATVVVH